MANEARRQHTARINSHLPASLSTLLCLALSFLFLILPRCLLSSLCLFSHSVKSQGSSLQFRPTHCVLIFMFVLQAPFLDL